MEGLDKYLEKRGYTRMKIGSMMDLDNSTMGKKLEHKRPWRLSELVHLWIVLRTAGERLAFGRLCSMAAVGLEEFDGEGR